MFCGIVVFLLYFFQVGLATRRTSGRISETVSRVNQRSELGLGEHAIALIQEGAEAVKENESRLAGVVSRGEFLTFRGAKVRQYECDAILVLRSERVDGALKRTAMVSRRIVDLNHSRLPSNGIESSVRKIRATHDGRCPPVGDGLLKIWR